MKKEGATNQAIAGLIADRSKIDYEYLYYVLKGKKEYINSLGRGIAQNNINLTILRDIEIPLPTLAKQKEFVKKLKARDETIKRLSEEIKKVSSEQKDFINKI